MTAIKLQKTMTHTSILVFTFFTVNICKDICSLKMTNFYQTISLNVFVFIKYYVHRPHCNSTTGMIQHKAFYRLQESL